MSGLVVWGSGASAPTKLSLLGAGSPPRDDFDTAATGLTFVILCRQPQAAHRIRIDCPAGGKFTVCGVGDELTFGHLSVTSREFGRRARILRQSR